VLRDKLGFGIYNVHMGFDPANSEQLATLLKGHGMHVDAEEVLTLDGFCKLRRELDAQPSGFLDSRIRRFQSFAEISRSRSTFRSGPRSLRHLDLPYS
jgi:exoribonuclease-2